MTTSWSGKGNDAPRSAARFRRVRPTSASNVAPPAGLAVVERPLQGRVVELGPGAHDGIARSRTTSSTDPVGIEIELPHQRRLVLTARSDAGMLAQHRWVQRDPTVSR